MGREDGAAGGTRFDQAYRKGRRGIDGDLVPPRGHQQASTIEAVAGQALSDINQVARYQRLNIRIGTGGALAFVFADLGTDFARK